MKVQTSRNKEHTCLLFLIEKVKAHTPTFILFVKLCKKPIKNLKKDISVPHARKLVVKTQQWHILYIVLSPLTLYWVLQGDQKHRKSFCTKDNAKSKMQRFVRTVFTPHGQNRAVLNSLQVCPRLDLKMWTKTKPMEPHSLVGVGWERFQTNPEHNKRRDAFQWQEVFRVEKNQGTT